MRAAQLELYMPLQTIKISLHQVSSVWDLCYARCQHSTTMLLQSKSALPEMLQLQVLRMTACVLSPHRNTLLFACTHSCHADSQQ